jgi:hypothetical protein
MLWNHRDSMVGDNPEDYHIKLMLTYLSVLRFTSYKHSLIVQGVNTKYNTCIRFIII